MNVPQLAAIVRAHGFALYPVRDGYRATWNGKPSADEIAFVEASHLESEIR